MLSKTNRFLELMVKIVNKQIESRKLLKLVTANYFGWKNTRQEGLKKLKILIKSSKLKPFFT